MDRHRPRHRPRQTIDVGMIASPPDGEAIDPAVDRIQLSRRYAAGVDGARGWLLTVLGEFVRPSNQPVPTSTFIDVLGRLGVEEQAGRQALARAAADGWLVSRREGRYAHWTLTAPAMDFLTLGEQRIFGFDPAPVDWDGRWLVVLTRVPESNRPARHLLRTRMRWSGFGSPSPGVWVSPHSGRAAEAEFVLDDAGVRTNCHVFVADHVAGCDVADLVRSAWDLDQIAHGYHAFVDEFAAEAADVEDPLAALVRLVHAWRRRPLTDPGLPRALLPAPWIGVRAAGVFHDRHAVWSPLATAAWLRIAEHRRHA